MDDYGEQWILKQNNTQLHLAIAQPVQWMDPVKARDRLQSVLTKSQANWVCCWLGIGPTNFGALEWATRLCKIPTVCEVCVELYVQSSIAFMAWCMIKQRKSVTYLFTYIIKSFVVKETSCKQLQSQSCNTIYILHWNDLIFCFIDTYGPSGDI